MLRKDTQGSRREKPWEREQRRQSRAFPASSRIATEFVLMGDRELKTQELNSEGTAGFSH
jgi:hypothetical protein